MQNGVEQVVVAFTFGMRRSPSVTVTVRWVWVKNSSSIQSG